VRGPVFCAAEPVPGSMLRWYARSLYARRMCGRVIWSSGSLRYAIVYRWLSDASSRAENRARRGTDGPSFELPTGNNSCSRAHCIASAAPSPGSAYCSQRGGLTSSRLRRIVETSWRPVRITGVEHAGKRAGSPCCSFWSLCRRCRWLCNCLDHLSLERTPARLASLFRHPAWARIDCDLYGLAVWVVVRSPT